MELYRALQRRLDQVCGSAWLDIKAVNLHVPFAGCRIGDAPDVMRGVEKAEIIQVSIRANQDHLAGGIRCEPVHGEISLRSLGVDLDGHIQNNLGVHDVLCGVNLLFIIDGLGHRAVNVGHIQLELAGSGQRWPPEQRARLGDEEIGAAGSRGNDLHSCPIRILAQRHRIYDRNFLAGVSHGIVSRHEIGYHGSRSLLAVTQQGDRPTAGGAASDSQLVERHQRAAANCGPSAG